MRDNKQQRDLFHETSPSNRDLPEVDSDRVRAWLGELIMLVFEAKAHVRDQPEVTDE
jgi:hypothetical protein